MKALTSDITAIPVASVRELLNPTHDGDARGKKDMPACVSGTRSVSDTQGGLWKCCWSAK